MRPLEFLDTASNFHPFECEGPAECVHCARAHVAAAGFDGTSYYSHDPATCALCDPEYDMQPNPWWDERLENEAKTSGPSVTSG